MRTNTTTQAAADPLLAAAAPSSRHPAESVEARRARRRLVLDSAWQRKIDEIITLSKASFGLTSDDAGNPEAGGLAVSSQLEARTDRAYEELAAIEDAMARIEDGTCGPGPGHDQPVSGE